MLTTGARLAGKEKFSVLHCIVSDVITQLINCPPTLSWLLTNRVDREGARWQNTIHDWRT